MQSVDRDEYKKTQEAERRETELEGTEDSVKEKELLPSETLLE